MQQPLAAGPAPLRVVAPVAAALCAAAAAGRPEAAAQAVEWDEPAVVASGPAIRGPWRQNESEYDYVDDPSVAIGGAGDLAVAWVDQRRKSVRLQLHGPDGRPRLERPADVSRSPEVFSWLPRVAFVGADRRTVAVAWQEIVFSGGSHGGEIFFARSTDGGRTFSTPVNLSRSVEGDGKGRLDRRRWDNGSLDLAAGPGDAVHVAWTAYEGGLRVARSGDAGASFSPPARVPGADGARPARGPSLAAGAGVVQLAWTVGEDPAADVRVAVSRDGGRTFEPPRVAVPTPGHSDAPRIAVDSRGAVHLVFSERVPGEPPRVLHAVAGPGGRSFSAPRPVHGGERGEGAIFPDLAIGPGGAIHVLSERLRDGDAEPRGFQLSVSTDGGRTFSPPADVPGTADGPATNGGQQGNFMRRLAVDGEGGVVVGFSRFQRGAASRVAVVRGERGGG